MMLRIYQLIIVIFLIIISLPLTISISFISFIKLKQNPFFLQYRYTFNKKKFLIYKFKTIKKTSIRIINNDFKRRLKENNIVSGYYSFLRKSKLDEIPQLFNILLGNINFIGPRPMIISRSNFLEKKIKNFKYRYKKKSGLTGLNQIISLYAKNINEEKIKNKIDLFYINNQSIFFDLYILFITFIFLFNRKISKKILINYLIKNSSIDKKKLINLI